MILFNKKFGYITLMTTLIVGAVASAIAISVLVLGLSSSRNSLLIQQSVQARALANSCGDNVLMIMTLDPTYTSGNGSITQPEGSCTYEAETNGSVTTILSTGSVGTVVRKISISVLNGFVTWQEVP